MSAKNSTHNGAEQSADICRIVRSLCPPGAHGGGALHQHSLPLSIHVDTLKSLQARLNDDSPLALEFSGEKNCCAILPPITHNCPRAYTLTLWVKVYRWSKTIETVLFRCRTSHSESIELLIASDDRTEGRCYCSIRVDAGSRVHNEAGGQLLMTPGRWHLLTFSHRCSPYPLPPKIAVRVDGELCLDRELDYPFGSAGVECTWTFGSGLVGAVSSLALYPFEVGPRFIKFISDAGPTCASLDCGVSNPQTSFDTGHNLIGTNFARLEDFLDAGKSSPLFCFTAHHFLPVDESTSMKSTKWTAFHSPGYLTNGFIELTSDCPLMNLTTVPTCMGDCRVGSELAHKYPLTHLWMAAGGAALPLYLLWEYCGRTLSSMSNVSDDHEKIRATLKVCILQTLSLLTTLVSTSVDFKDSLLQNHGFHVISLSLRRFSSGDTAYYIDKSLVDACIGLVLGLGDDAAGGDGAIAAIQGLLLDFDLWMKAPIAVRAYLLNVICELTPNIGTIIHKAVGLQYVLDVVRVHILEAYDAGVVPTAVNIAECIVTVTLESARRIYNQKLQQMIGGANSAPYVAAAKATQPSVTFYETDILLRCLEESKSNDCVEIVMRCIVRLIHEAPEELEAALENARFNDTTMVYLLCRRGLSGEIRHSALYLMLWNIHRAHGLLIDDINELCQYMFRKGTVAAASAHGNRDWHASPPASTSANRRGSVNTIRSAFTDGRRIKELFEVLRSKKIILQRLWRLLCMLSECWRRALRDGAWDSSAIEVTNEGPLFAKFAFEAFSVHSSEDDVVKNPIITRSLKEGRILETDRTVHHVASLLLHDGPLGQLDAWLVLPLMAVMLPYLDTQKMEELLASLGVILKTSEPQVLAFCVLADNFWVKYFVDIAVMVQGRDHSDGTGRITSSDLALDAFIQVLVFQLHHFGNSAWLSWKAFHSHLRRDISTCVGTNEISIIRKCAGFLLVKLTKHHHDYSEDILTCLSKIIVFIEEKRLCGNDLIVVGAGLTGYAHNISAPSCTDSTDLLDLSNLDTFPNSASGHGVNSVILLQEEERHLLAQLSSFMNSLRAISHSIPLGKPTPFGFSEVKVLQPCVRILLGCLPHADLAFADTICLELRSAILHSADRWMFYDPEYYKLFIVDVFGALHSAISKNNVAAHVKDRYRTAVLTIAHIFLELRRVSFEQSGFISPHVVPTLDAVGITEGYFDSDVVLSLLHKYLETARDSIVSDNNGGGDFGEDEYDMMGSSPLNGNTSISRNDVHDGAVDDVLCFEPLPVIAQDRDNLIDLLNNDEAETFEHSLEENYSRKVVDEAEESFRELSTSVDLLDLSDSREASNTLIESQPSSQRTIPVKPGAHDLSDQELFFRDWIHKRQGIIMERLDSSKNRLEKFQQAVVLSCEANQKCWRRLRRKVLTESFLEDQWCSWKLGISHEGHFPGRRRVIVRPRFLDVDEPDKLYQKARPYVCGDEHILNHTESEEDCHESVERKSLINGKTEVIVRRANSFTNSSNFGPEGSDSMLALLEMAKSAIIADPIASRSPNELKHNDRDMDSTTHHIPAAKPSGALVEFGGRNASLLEHNWGLVDADDDEAGGYGVVGYVPAVDIDQNDSGKVLDESDDISRQKSGCINHQEEASVRHHPDTVGDMQFDIMQLDMDARQGRSVSTGASLPGTRRVSANKGSLMLFDAPVTLITASGNYIGHISFTNGEIYFVSTRMGGDDNAHLLDAAAVTLMPDRRIRRRKWLVERISGIYLRTYRLRESAIEVFFRRGKHRNFFVDFGSVQEDMKKRNAFAKALMNIAPQTAIKQWPHSTIFRLLHEHGMQEMWLNGHVSNFDYIMFLNTMAGRSYNDLCQYPVFPWVLSQYDKSSIDLSDPSNYRDLSKPVGALNPSRLADFVERYKSFGDSEIPPFMYGSHYSTMVGVVLHYLVRLQPFASLHQEIQNGRFDVPDRLFSSIPRTWDHNFNMLSEVKELTPEFFTLPEFLKNVNNFDLGRVQDGKQVGDVELPPWAATAEDFIRINREALESDYVSNNMHNWIDLIFGFKQRGQAAVEANNVFYYLTYSGTVDREKLDDVTKKCVDLQIAHFGQCPNQLFGSPHPQKRTGNPPVPRALIKCFKSPKTFRKPSIETKNDELGVANKLNMHPVNVSGLLEAVCIEEALVVNSCASVVPGPPTSAVVAIKIAGKKMTCVRDNGVIDVYKYGFTESAKMALAAYAKMYPGGPLGRKGSVLPSSAGNTDNAVLAAARTVHPNDMSVYCATPSGQSESEAQQEPDIISFEAFDMVENTISKRAPCRGGHHESGIVNGDIANPIDRFPFLQWSTRDRIVITAESVVSCSVTVPRLPVSHIRTGGNISSEGDDSVLKKRIADTRLVHFLRLGSLILTAGRSDGMISVRELDTTSGAQLTGGDFRGHKFQVTFLSSDSIPNGNSSLVASCDISGQILVWTVSVSSHNGFNRHIISRRPQRVFRCFPGENCCDISWQMGVVVAGSKHCVSLFSIERNERFRIIDVRGDVFSRIFETGLSSHVDTTEIRLFLANVSNEAASGELNSVNGVSNSGRFNNNRLWEHNFGCIVDDVVCCDYGSIIAYVKLNTTEIPISVQFLQQLPKLSSSSSTLHLLISYTVSGACTGFLVLPSCLTCLGCPGRGTVVTIGTEDGHVTFANSISLLVLHSVKPHEKCIRLSSLGDVMTVRSDSRGHRNLNFARDEIAQIENKGTKADSIPSSAIVTIKVGPKLDRPTFVAASNFIGQIFLIPFLDFVKFEKMQATTAFANIVSAPIQAVKGTIQSAQNFTILAGDAAGSIAQNARGIAGDAIGEAHEYLKKINKSKLLKGVGTFFSGGRASSSDT